jgi:excisionase family DNA binding protein
MTKHGKLESPLVGETLLTLTETAEVLRLSTRTVREYLKRGEVGGKLIGNRWRFRRADLDALLENAPSVRTGCVVSLGAAALAIGCATLPKAAICAEVGAVRWPPYFALSETYLVRSPGFLTCSPRLKRRKLASVSCHPSAGTRSGETLAVDSAPASSMRETCSRFSSLHRP